ncbi:phage holin family protein [Thermoflavimicrobium dichotomicum]|uniref:Putative membrane protein n=1 Tax=Thermoflavimicrobium dichotomicum TaxID=46223 RepID=A0A1I3JUB4_9BACL|nr:phage holin family protein [Thermoflavimicrobium dichotomicum]SFI63859.1 putative membrane protein [Thermoflavimicrobium dichotomicum]
MSWLVKWIIKTLLIGISVYVAASYIDGIYIESVGAAILMSIILAVLNTLIRPILVFLTLPINILTLGLFILVINAFLFWFAGMLVDGLRIEGVIPAVLGALVVSIVSWILDLILNRK